jgi:hypothetical protein
VGAEHLQGVKVVAEPTGDVSATLTTIIAIGTGVFTMIAGVVGTAVKLLDRFRLQNDNVMRVIDAMRSEVAIRQEAIRHELSEDIETFKRESSQERAAISMTINQISERTARLEGKLDRNDHPGSHRAS